MQHQFVDYGRLSEKIANSRPLMALRHFDGADTTSGVPDQFWTVGDVVRKLRDRAGLSQEQLSERADINKSTLNDVERDTGNPTQRTLMRIAAALQVSVADLHTLAETTALTQEEVEWLKQLRELRGEWRTRAKSVVETEVRAQRRHSMNGLDSPTVEDHEE